MTELVKAPKIGDYVTVGSHDYRVLKVYDFGTMDAETADGRTVRITGLGWLKKGRD